MRYRDALSPLGRRPWSVPATTLEGKPHIRRYKGQWECRGKGTSCLSPTVAAAWRAWNEATVHDTLYRQEYHL